MHQVSAELLPHLSVGLCCQDAAPGNKGPEPRQRSGARAQAGQQPQDLRHGGQVLHPLRSQGLEQAARVQGGQNDGGQAVQYGHDDAPYQGEDVGHRQHDQHPLAPLPQDLFLVHPGAVEVLIVRHERSQGETTAPVGVVQGGDRVVQLQPRAAPLPGLIAHQAAFPPSDQAPAGQVVCENSEMVALGDHGRGVAVGEDLVELELPVLELQGRRHRPELEEGEEDAHEVRGVLQE